MLIHADVSGLELATAAYLSQDPVLIQELSSGMDIHADNQKRWNLPERVIAKIFVFKLLYGGTGFGFANQVEFQHISKSQKFWDKRIEDFYNKYIGIRKWHESLVREVCSSGRLVMPTGRTWVFPIKDVLDRLWYWRSKILNYPVQGTGADLVAIGRVTSWKRLRRDGLHVLWQSTVHDSIDIDVPLDKGDPPCYNNVCKVIDSSIRDIPSNFYRLWGKPFNVPIKAEILIGPNLGELKEWQKSPS